MSDRTLKAILILEASQWAEGAAHAGESTEELEERLKRLQDTADGVNADHLVKEQDKVSNSSSKTSESLDGVGKSIEDLDHQQLSLTPVETALGKVAEDASVKGEQIGRNLGDGVGKGVEDLPEKIRPTTDKLPEPFGPSGDKAGRTFAENFEKHHSEFVAFGKTMGDDFYKSFNGDSEGALSKLNQLFNESFDKGGLSAASLFSSSFDKRVKSSKPADGAVGAILQAMEKAGVEGGDLLGNGIIGGIQNAFKIFQALPPEAQAGVAGAAVAAGVIFGAAFMAAADAAVLGIVGAGGLVAGIIAEVHNPAVTAAFSGLAGTVSDDMAQAASSFLSPLKNAAGILGDAFDSTMPNLEAFFNELAPSIDRLANGAGILVQELGAGLAASGGSASQVLNAIADILPIIGFGVAEFFAELAAGGTGAADIVRLLGTLIAGTLIVLGNGIETGAVLFQGLTIGAEGLLAPLMLILKALEGIPGIGGAAKAALVGINNAFDGGASKSHTAASGVNDFATAARGTADAAVAADKAVSDLFDEFEKGASNSLQADQAAIDYKNSLTQLAQSIQQNGHDTTEATAAGRALKAQFDSTAQSALSAADAARQNAESQGLGGVAAAHAYSQALAGNISQLAASAEQEGYSKQATAALIAELFGVPKDIATEFATPGAAAAKKAAQDLEYAIAAIQTKKDIDIYLNVHGQVPDPTPGYGGNTNYGFGALGTVHGVRHAATGMLDAGVYSDGPIMFAEPATGGEAFVPRLTPDVDRARAITEQAAAWHGGHVQWGNGPVTAAPMGSGTSASPEAIGRAVRDYLAPLVGNSVTNQFTAVEADPQRIAEAIYFTTKSRG